MSDEPESTTPAVAAPAEKVAAFENVVKNYVLIRDKIKEQDKLYDDKMAPLKGLLNELSGKLTSLLEDVGAESIKTAAGTAYSTTRYSASLKDPQAFMEYVIKSEAWDLLDRKANATAVRDFIATNGSEPPGSKLSVVRSVGVRRAPGT